MINKKQIKKGDNVSVIIKVWRYDQFTTIENHYTGKITQIVEGAENCIYVQISGLDKLIPVSVTT